MHSVLSTHIFHAAAIKADGTVMAVKPDGAESRCIGLKKDGSVVMAGRNEHSEFDVSAFSDVKMPE